MTGHASEGPVRLPEGRTLSFTRYGAADGPIVTHGAGMTDPTAAHPCRARSRCRGASRAAGGEPVSSEHDDDRWLDGAQFTQFIACPPEHVWDYLLAIDQTPTWRTHLHAVAWADAGPVGVGSRITVSTSLLWYRNVTMVCEVTRFEPDTGVFAYRVVDGPATTENEYRVQAQGDGTRFDMKGRLLLDSRLIRLTGPFLKLAEDLLARREVKRLKRLLEDG